MSIIIHFIVYFMILVGVVNSIHEAASTDISTGYIYDEFRDIWSVISNTCQYDAIMPSPALDIRLWSKHLIIIRYC